MVLADQVSQTRPGLGDLESRLNAYEARGIRCFAVKPDKRPFKAWRDCVSKSTDERVGEFRALHQEGTPFLIAGIPGRNVVVDVDDIEGFARWLAGRPFDQSCPAVGTPSGGMHFWFGSTEGVQFRNFPWGEIRTGDAHYMLLPGGSEADYEKDGRRIRGSYEWAAGCTPLTDWAGELPALPAALADLWERPSADGEPQPAGGPAADILEGVLQGQRNETLFRYATSLRDRGLTQHEALVLLGLAAANCSPPYPSDEGEDPVDEMAARVYATPTPEGVSPGEADPSPEHGSFVALRRARQIKAEGAYAYGFDPETGGGRLMVYGGGVWLPAVGVDVRVQQLLGEGVSRKRVAETIAALQRDVPRRPWGEWNPERLLVNCPNGIVDPTTGELHPHDPELWSTIQIAVEWDPDARCERMDQLLREVLPDDGLDLACTALGYLLVPNISADKLFIVVGPTSTGKTTFLTVVQALVGELNTAVVSLQDLADNRFALAQLENKLLCVLDDLDNTPLRSAVVPKVLSGGFPRIRVEHKGKDAYSAPLYARLLFTCNEVPSCPDKTPAWYRRLLLLPFTKRPRRVDPHLVEKVTTPEALQRLLVLVVQGLGRLIRNDMAFPEQVSSTELMSRYRGQNDTVVEFVGDCCEIGAEFRVLKTGWYKAYTDWCAGSGYRAVGRGEAYERACAIEGVQEVKGDRGERLLKGMRVADHSGPADAGSWTGSGQMARTATQGAAEPNRQDRQLSPTPQS